MADHTGNLVSRIIADQRPDHVERTINAASRSSRGQHAQTAEAEIHALHDALTAVVACLPAHAALANGGGTPSPVRTLLNGRRWVGERRLAAFVLSVLLPRHDVWVIVFVLAQVEAEVVDNVALVDDIAALGHVAHSHVRAQDLQLGDVVWVRGGTQAGEDASLSQEERPGADAHKCALAVRVALLDLGELLDQCNRLRLGLKYNIATTAGNDHEIELSETLHGVLVSHVRPEGGTLGGDGVLLGSGKEDLERLGLYEWPISTLHWALRYGEAIPGFLLSC